MQCSTSRVHRALKVAQFSGAVLCEMFYTIEMLKYCKRRKFRSTVSIVSLNNSLSQNILTKSSTAKDLSFKILSSRIIYWDWESENQINDFGHQLCWLLIQSFLTYLGISSSKRGLLYFNLVQSVFKFLWCSNYKNLKI